MSKRRMLSLRKLKPESVQEYTRLHQQVWPELLEAYCQAGITEISCFLNGVNLVVYMEYESEIYEQEKDALNGNPIEIRWQALMKALDDTEFEQRHFDEVFHMLTEEKIR